VADKSSSKPAKRRLKAPVTVREQAETAQAKADKPKRELPSGANSFVSGFTWPLRKLWAGLTWISRYTIPPYFRNSAKELRLVTWPNRKQSRQLTVAVMVFAVIFGVLIAGVDWLLDKVFKGIILR
jgi:preprotein translocase subunit SecE